MRSASLLLAVLVLAVCLPLHGVDVNATLRVDPSTPAGTHPTTGNLLLYSPDTLERGSSLSHWDPSASPDLLMEPSASPNVPFGEVDLTLPQMHDVGWPLGGGAVVTLRVQDDPDEGFNDPDLGPQRLAAFQFAADIWAALLPSPVEINVEAGFEELECEDGSGVLASAGAQFIFESFPGAPVAGTWFHGALAEALSGQNLSLDDVPDDPDAGDIVVTINSEIDEGCLGAGTGFDYDLDGNTPPQQINFVNVMTHELAHGLGFSFFANPETGQLFLDLPDTYTRFMFDTTTGLHWSEMTNAQRVVSATNSLNLVWDGPEVTALAGSFLEPAPVLVVNSPAGIAGNFVVATALFGPQLDASGVTGDLALASPSLACQPLANASEIDGKIAVVDRGDCLFVTKVKNAQDAGAVGVIVVNNVAGAPVTMAGDDPEIVIPSVHISQEDGALIKSTLAQADVPSVCTPGPSTLCLRDDRFLVEVEWRDFEGNTGVGQVVPFGTEDSGLFYFFNPNNWELLVKVLRGCSINDHYWVFAAATTNVEYTLRVSDTQAGLLKEYFNPLGQASDAITDTSAFATCP